MEYLYVCHFSNGHIKVGRSVYPKSRIAQHADRVVCVGIELVEHHIVECVGHSAPAESALIEKCAAAATKRSKSEWFIGLDYTEVCEWAQQVANMEFEPPQPKERVAFKENEALNEAIKTAGGVTALSRSLGLSGHQVIYQWGLTRVPAEYCPKLEKLTGVRCELLRPDMDWAVLRGSHLAPSEAKAA